ncbi:MAG: TlpA disulfide reductase family protein [Pseudomonadota bacterium]
MKPARIVATVAALIALASPLAHAAGPVAGDVAPNELGKTYGGDKVLLSNHAGKVVIVSFWATWCAYCLKELPILEGIQKVAGKAHDLQVVAVNTEDRDTFRHVLRTLKTMTVAMAYDPDKIGQKAYGVSGIPHLVIIGRDGVIIRVYRGYGEETLGKITDDINLAIGATGEAKSAP